MRIEKVDIKGFGRLTNMELEFGKGLNIVYGSNEAGKTSLQWFIKGMFFGLKGGRASKDGMLPPAKRYKPWRGSDFSGSMEYRLYNGELYRVGRNYAANTVKVFDSLFNDITGTFETSRERGPHFAEKHLGMNETCFDKTVFIKQMETRIGEDDSRELLNRLVNISQTGFEDVSFKRAHEALKEALKNHVGTDKTTTRPLDKLTVRLQELKNLRVDLIQKRELMFETEKKLVEAADTKALLQQRKAALVRLKEFIETARRVFRSRKLGEELKDIFNHIEKEETELKSVITHIETYSEDREQLAGFASYSEEDIDSVDRNYNKLVGLLEENKRLEAETVKKKDEMGKIEHQLEPLKAFNYLGDNIENEIIELDRNLEHLRKEQEKSGIQVLNEKIGYSERKSAGCRKKAMISAAITAIMFLAGVFGFYLGFAAASLLMVLTLIFTYLGYKEAKYLKILLNEKRISFVNLNSITEEIQKKQDKLRDICEKVEADSVGDFLRIKAGYDTRVQQVTFLNNDISRLEYEQETNSKTINMLKKVLADILFESGLIDDKRHQVNEELVKSFKHSVRKYWSVEPNIKYSQQRVNDLTNNNQKYLKSAAAVYGKECSSKEQLAHILLQLEKETNSSEGRLKDLMGEIRDMQIMEELSAVVSACIDQDFQDENLNGMESAVDRNYQKVEDELGSTLLRIRELETLLKGMNDDDRIQRIDEEIEEFEFKKSQLEDINVSLKTALDVLTEASAEIQRDFVPTLNISMSGIIDRITRGRYKDLRADDSLMLRVISPETSEVATAVSLSGGTIDQMYLALRVAMADLVGSDGEKLPLIMDEVLAQYDDDRTRDAIEFLGELSCERQIILFTCKGREVDIAREVCDKSLKITSLI